MVDYLSKTPLNLLFVILALVVFPANNMWRLYASYKEVNDTHTSRTETTEPLTVSSTVCTDINVYSTIEVTGNL